jgi:hypothetical protein
MVGDRDIAGKGTGTQWGRGHGHSGELNRDTVGLGIGSQLGRGQGHSR